MFYQSFRKLLFLILLAPFYCMASEWLEEGEWTGVLTNHLGDRHEYKFLVSYKCIMDKQGVSTKNKLVIEMINLDHEFHPDYKYSLFNIELNDISLRFDFQTSSDTKSCVTEKEPNCVFDCKYEGKCISDKAKNGEISYLYLISPV